LEIIDFEKAILSVILRNPASSERIAPQIASELDYDKFSTTEHKTLYKAIQEMIMTQQAPSVGNLCAKLGSQLSVVGGEPYLFALHAFLDVIRTPNGDGWESWVRKIDTAGRLRHLGLVMDSYTEDYKDFEKLVSNTDDPDAYIAKFMEKINKGTMSLKTSYKSISHYADIERQKMEIERTGGIQDLVPTNMPSLYNWFIPRPGSFGVLTGISSMGKTQMALQIALGAAIFLKENKIPGIITINELETLGWRLNRRMCCCLAGVDSRNLASGLATPEELERYEATMSFVEQLPIWIDDNPDITSSQFSNSAIAIGIERGPRVLGVSDYVELFTDKGESEELRISNAVRQIRKVGWATGAAEIVISQLNNSVMMTDSKIGGLARTRYSGAIGQAADWFGEVYNPVAMKKANIDFTLPDGMVEDMAYLLIHKNKDYPIGWVPFEWIPQYTRFQDPTLSAGKVYL
jgi:replicative DNA helicase